MDWFVSVFLLCSAAGVFLKHYTTKAEKQNRADPEGDALREAEAQHQRELAEWDEQFRKETGIDLRAREKNIVGSFGELGGAGGLDFTTGMVTGSFNQILAPGFREALEQQRLMQQSQEFDMQRLAMLQQGNPNADPRLLANLGNLTALFGPDLRNPNKKKQ